MEDVVAFRGINDIDTAFNRFVTLEATENEKAKDVGEGIIVAELKDPWENIIGLIHNPHFKIILILPKTKEQRGANISWAKWWGKSYVENSIFVCDPPTGDPLPAGPNQ